MTEEFKRIPWNEYKEILERFGYDETQISAVKEVRETAEEITKEQFDFLVSSGIIKKKVKLKKIRSTEVSISLSDFGASNIWSVFLYFAYILSIADNSPSSVFLVFAIFVIYLLLY